MRYAVLMVLVLLGCDDSPNRQEFTNLSAQTLGDRERLAALERAVGAPAVDPMMMSFGARLSAL